VERLISTEKRQKKGTRREAAEITTEIIARTTIGTTTEATQKEGAIKETEVRIGKEDQKTRSQQRTMPRNCTDQESLTSWRTCLASGTRQGDTKQETVSFSEKTT
jgi:hypothetical protein